MAHTIQEQQSAKPCYAHAAASAMAHAWRRVAFATPPSFQQLLDAIVAKFGEHGGHAEVAVKHFGDPANLTPDERAALFPGTDYEHLPRLRVVNIPSDDVTSRLAELQINGMQIVVSFYLSKERWERFRAFFSANPDGVLQASDLELQPNDTDTWGDGSGGHAAVLDPNASAERSHLAITNNWGPEWGHEHHFLRVANLSVLQPHGDQPSHRVRAFNVVWHAADIGRPLRERFESRHTAVQVAGGAPPVVHQLAHERAWHAETRADLTKAHEDLRDTRRQLERTTAELQEAKAQLRSALGQLGAAKTNHQAAILALMTDLGTLAEQNAELKKSIERNATP